VDGLEGTPCFPSSSLASSAVADEEDSAAGSTFQTVHVPLSPLQLRIDGKLHTDAAEFDKAKDSLTFAFFRLLRSHYGACLDHVDLQLSLEQVRQMPLTVADDDEDGGSGDGTAGNNDDQTAKQQDRDEAILTAEAIATLHCKTADMPLLSIKDVDEIIGRSKETFKHVASIVFTSPTSSDSLYHFLVRIAFNTSESRDVPTSHSSDNSADPVTISINRKLDVDDGGDLHSISSSASATDEHSSDISTRALESEVTCIPQVAGRIKFMRGEFICSPSLEYSFGVTRKGDLSLLRNGETLWSANTRGSYALMQADGNLVVRSSSLWPLWASGTSDNPNASLSLGDNGVAQIVNRNGKRVWKISKPTNSAVDSKDSAGFDVSEGDDEGEPKQVITCVEQVIGKIRLYTNDYICSPDRRFLFGMSSDGDLSLLDQITQPSTKLWSAETSRASSGGDAYAKLQKDGNLVISTTSGSVLWTSRTAGAGDEASLILGNNGVASIFDSKGRRVWSARGIGVDVDYYSDDISTLNNKFQQGNSNSNSPPLSPSALEGYSCLDQVIGDKMTFDQGQFICSADSNWLFGVDNDGDLSLWSGSTKVWSAGTAVGEPTSAKFSQRGNLVVKAESTDEPLWTSKTPGNPGASLFLGNVGSAMITDVNGKKLWIIRGGDSVPTPTPPPTPDPNNYICKDQVEGKIELARGEFICSDVYRFGVSPDNGDLSLWVSVDSSAGIKIWSADSEGATKATLQVGGNLVVRDETGNPIWTSKTSNNEGASLILGTDGIANIVSTDGMVLWTTSTPFGGRGAGDGPPPPIPPSFPPTPPITAPPTPTPIATPPPVNSGSPTSSGPTSTNGCISIPSSGGRIELYAGQYVCSSSGTYRFGLDVTGDLGLWKNSNKKWSAGTGGDGSGSGADNYAKLKDDGTLIVRNSDRLLWSSNTSSSGSSHEGSTIQVHDDGIATITSVAGFYIWSSAAATDELVVDSSTLEKKIMAGYQGWFYTDSDGGLNRWQHWSDARTTPDKNTITIDMWPDLREYDADELADTDFKYRDESTAGLYSAYTTKTVERHCRWLQEYDIDGLFVQRFIGDALAWPHIRDQVLNNVRSGSEKYGRVFVNMYDIGNGDQRTLVEDIKRDWMHLVDDEHITESKSYLRHRGKPVLAMWGWGFTDRIGTPSQAKELIAWFQETADPRYRATVMGGVPAGWRTLSRDSRTNSGWSGVYRSFDIISPWTVGRMVDAASADYFEKHYIDPDMAECDSLGIDYLPVVFPGFSSHNLKPEKPFNEIPRLGGNFLWKQLHNVIRSGSTMIYVAMFDETDEGTAIFKTAESVDQNPTRGEFLTLDADAGYDSIPSDWYLRLTGAAGRILKGGTQDIAETVPENP